MLEPFRGRIFDPCCGSGGMFVQSEKFIEAHGGRIGDVSIFGQESNQTTWRLCKMNIAIRGIDARIEWSDSFRDDQFKDLKVDFILANPPFNDSDWGAAKFRAILSSNIRHGIYKPKEYADPRGVRLLKMGDVNSNDRISDQNLERVLISEDELERFRINDENLVFARTSMMTGFHS